MVHLSPQLFEVLEVLKPDLIDLHRIGYISPTHPIDHDLICLPFILVELLMIYGQVLA